MRISTIQIILNSLCIIPVIIGSIRFNRLDYCFRLLLINILLGMIADIHILNKLLLNTPLLYNLKSRLYTTCDGILLVAIYLCWLREKNRNKLFLISTSLILVAIIDSLIFGISSFRTSLIDIFCPFIVVVFAIRAFVVLVADKSNQQKTAKLMIVIPQIVFYSYFLIISVLSFFLYTKSKSDFFFGLYSPIIILNALCSISYSIALIWLPKKERFL